MAYQPAPRCHPLQRGAEGPGGGGPPADPHTPSCSKAQRRWHRHLLHLQPRSSLAQSIHFAPFPVQTQPLDPPCSDGVHPLGCFAGSGAGGDTQVSGGRGCPPVEVGLHQSPHASFYVSRRVFSCWYQCRGLGPDRPIRGGTCSHCTQTRGEQLSLTMGIFHFLQHGQEAIRPLAGVFLALQGYGMLLQTCTGPANDPNRRSDNQGRENDA